MNTLSRKQGWMLHGALLTVAIVFPLVFSSPFWVNFGVLALFYAFIGQSWNISGGFAGQLSFGHVVFFGAGAYASTILQMRFGFNPWWGLPASALAGGVVGFVIAFLSFRAGLKGSYFALITLAFAEVLRIVANSVEITGGGLGMLIPAKPGAANFQFAERVGFYWVILLMTVGSIAVAIWLKNSRFGAQLAAIRENEDAARALGIIRLYAEASELARPVFARAGYALLHRRDFTIPFEGGAVAIHNYAMEKRLT